MIKVIAGSHKGKEGKVVAAYPRKHAVAVEGIGLAKRHIKPSQINPRGGTKEIHIPLDVSKVKLIQEKKSKRSKS